MEDWMKQLVFVIVYAMVILIVGMIIWRIFDIETDKSFWIGYAWAWTCALIYDLVYAIKKICED
jgi:hypothetical protein